MTLASTRWDYLFPFHVFENTSREWRSTLTTIYTSSLASTLWGKFSLPPDSPSECRRYNLKRKQGETEECLKFRITSVGDSTKGDPAKTIMRSQPEKMIVSFVKSEFEFRGGPQPRQTERTSVRIVDSPKMGWISALRGQFWFPQPETIAAFAQEYDKHAE